MTIKRTITISYTCEAPECVRVVEWDDIPPEHQAIINEQGRLECSGGFTPGSWCKGCHYFGGETEEGEELEIDGEVMEED